MQHWKLKLCLLWFVCVGFTHAHTQTHTQLYPHYLLAATRLQLLSCHTIDVICVDCVHPLVRHRVEGPGCHVTGVTLRKVKSWETDGMHTLTCTRAYTFTLALSHTHTIPHTFNTPKGTDIYCATQMGIASAFQSLTNTDTHKHTQSAQSSRCQVEHEVFLKAFIILDLRQATKY